MLRSEIVRRILQRRGIDSASVEKFLHPSMDDLARPEELLGVVEAADALLAAAAAGRRIVVFGDYDCDGVCATAILVKTLRAVWKGDPSRVEDEVVPFIPNRLDEGYGMSDLSLSRMLRENPNVAIVVTVDNGINAVSQIAGLRARGVAVVVTDHHLPGESLPIADALVNPRVAASDRLRDLCGAGVAFLLARRVISEARARGLFAGASFGGTLLVLAGLATVTDIMPLMGQNRILVHEALAHFGEWAPIGLKELHLRGAKTAIGGRMCSKDFGYVLGPRINAAGRIASGMEALELLLSDDREITRELARMVDGYNVDRKSVEQRMSDEALLKVVSGASAQVIDMPEGHPGVAGIVASRVMEKLGGQSPVCVIAGGHGSARAPDHINIRDAFVACAEVLDTYGGHAAAGGFSVKPGKVDEFRRLLCEYCDKLKTQPSANSGSEPDVWIDSADIDLELAEMLKEIEPFGEGNPEPIFGLRGATIRDVRLLGSDGRHLSMVVNNRRAVWWNHGSEIESIRALAAESRDLRFALMISDYGERHVEMRLISIS